jgi:hypothetical protein
MPNWNEIFDYKDGELYWKCKQGRARVGVAAGTVDSTSGYKRISYKRKPYLAHRIVWEMHNWPIPSNKEIDHADGNKTNNKIENLRCCAHNQNGQNRKINKNSATGHSGVSWHKGIKKWCAKIRYKRKQIHLGSYDDINDAIAARKKAEQDLGWNQF